MTGPRPSRLPAASFVDSGPALAPLAFETYQVPFTPWPLTSPALASLAYLYIGQPPTVTCLLPSARVTSPIMALSTPDASTAPVLITGGQVFAQSPSQVDFGGFAVSLSKR